MPAADTAKAFFAMRLAQGLRMNRAVSFRVRIAPSPCDQLPVVFAHLPTDGREEGEPTVREFVSLNRAKPRKGFR